MRSPHFRGHDLRTYPGIVSAVGLFNRKASKDNDPQWNYDRGATLAIQGDVVRALPYLLRASELGSAKATTYLGHLADEGGDPDAALAYYLKAANAGDPGASFHIGSRYHRRALRSGDPEDWEAAWEWLVKAHQAGVVEAYSFIRATEYDKPPYPEWWGQRPK